MNDLKGRCCRNTKRSKDHQTTVFDIIIIQLLHYYKWFANFCKSSWDEIKKNYTLEVEKLFLILFERTMAVGIPLKKLHFMFFFISLECFFFWVFYSLWIGYVTLMCIFFIRLCSDIPTVGPYIQKPFKIALEKQKEKLHRKPGQAASTSVSHWVYTTTRQKIGLTTSWPSSFRKLNVWWVGRKAQPSVSLMFLPHFHVLCDLLLNRRTATWNLFVLYNKEF